MKEIDAAEEPETVDKVSSSKDSELRIEQSANGKVPA